MLTLFSQHLRLFLHLRSFLGCLQNSDIKLINDDKMVTDDKTLAKTFNEHYVNTVERSSGSKLEKMEYENSLHTSRNILRSNYRSLQESS